MDKRAVRSELLPAESKVMEKLGGLPLDFRAMAAISNLFRASMAVRRRLEANVLASDRLSWTSFSSLWVLWVWGDMEVRDLASAVCISRPTATGVVATLKRRGLVKSRPGEHDGRTVFVELTTKGRRTIERVFPSFNAEEAAVASCLAPAEQDQLAGLLRSLLRGVDPKNQKNDK
ncbi:MarR family winged helix-turn-helix transcriptional regulator [Pendulispora albinea]|uniref:MarR family transcriptional regulator n=1 Tax=Pendulispora albinea TaxID=2741071 RepID=A0ABZ2LXL4_9BACT